MMDPPKGPITKLPNEILLLILEKAGGFNLLVAERSKRSLLSVSLISHRFNVLANKILIRKISLVISPRYLESNMRLFQRLYFSRSLNSLVRCIEVDGIYGPWTDTFELMPPITQPQHYLNYVESFGETFCYLKKDWYRTERTECFGTNIDQMLTLRVFRTKCLGLEVFRWNACMPLAPKILDTIRTFLPKCTIELTRFPLLPQLGDSIHALQTLTPNHLKVLYSGIIPDAPLRGHGSLDLVAPMQKLKKLILYNTSTDFSNNFIRPPPREEGVISFPELQEVELMNYEPRDEDEEKWTDLMNWTQIKNLSLTSTALIRMIYKSLTQLDSFAICKCSATVLDDEDIIRSFLLNTRGLHTLELGGLPGVIRNDVLSHVGLALKSLKLLSGYGKLLSLSQILQLGHYCKNFTHLALDLDLSHEWPPPTLEALANNFHHVSRFDLWIILNHKTDTTGARTQSANPVNTIRQILISHLWAYLWKEREKYRHYPAPGVSITRLHYLEIRGHADILREPESQEPLVVLPFRLHSTMPVITAPGELLHATGNEFYFDIRASERDDEIDFGKAIITCCELEDYRRLVKEHGPFGDGVKVSQRFVDCPVEEPVLPDEISYEELGSLTWWETFVHSWKAVEDDEVIVDAEVVPEEAPAVDEGEEEAKGREKSAGRTRGRRMTA